MMYEVICEYMTHRKAKLKKSWYNQFTDCFTDVKCMNYAFKNIHIDFETANDLTDELLKKHKAYRNNIQEVKKGDIVAFYGEGMYIHWAIVEELADDLYDIKMSSKWGCHKVYYHTLKKHPYDETEHICFINGELYRKLYK